jgi:hypothetical protein
MSCEADHVEGVTLGSDAIGDMDMDGSVDIVACGLVLLLASARVSLIVAAVSITLSSDFAEELNMLVRNDVILGGSIKHDDNKAITRVFEPGWQLHHATFSQKKSNVSLVSRFLGLGQTMVAQNGVYVIRRPYIIRFQTTTT